MFALLFGSLVGLATSIILRTGSYEYALGPIPFNDEYVRFGIPALLALLFSLWAFGEFTFSLKYLVGRTQYYIALSQIVFEHMGLKSKGLEWNEPLREKLRERAKRPDRGIEGAVISLFEARLFASKCAERSGKQGEFEDLISKENLESFDIKEDEMIVIKNYEHHFEARILGKTLGKLGFVMRDLVFLAHHDYSSDESKELLKLAFDR